MVINDPNVTSLSDRARLQDREAAQQADVIQREELKKSTAVVMSGSTIGALAGGGAVVLTIIALAHILPNYLGPIAAIVLGGALIAEGGGIAIRLQKLAHETYGSEYGTLNLGGGAGVEFVGGAGGVVLGILALVGMVPMVLLGCAVIALGAAAMLSVGTVTRLNHMSIRASQAHPTAQEAASYAVAATASAQALIGAGAVVLGILALVGIAPLVLDLVGLLVIGGGLLMGGSAIAARMGSVMPR